MVPLGGADSLDHETLHMFGFWRRLESHVCGLFVCAEFSVMPVCKSSSDFLFLDDVITLSPMLKSQLASAWPCPAGSSAASFSFAFHSLQVRMRGFIFWPTCGRGCSLPVLCKGPWEEGLLGFPAEGLKCEIHPSACKAVSATISSCTCTISMEPSFAAARPATAALLFFKTSEQNASFAFLMLLTPMY